MVIVLSLLTFIYISWLCGHKTTASQNGIYKAVFSQDRFLYLIYFFTSYLQLASTAVMFSHFSKATVSLE